MKSTRTRKLTLVKHPVSCFCINFRFFGRILSLTVKGGEILRWLGVYWISWFRYSIFRLISIVRTRPKHLFIKNVSPMHFRELPFLLYSNAIWDSSEMRHFELILWKIQKFWSFRHAKFWLFMRLIKVRVDFSADNRFQRIEKFSPVQKCQCFTCYSSSNTKILIKNLTKRDS